LIERERKELPQCVVTKTESHWLSETGDFMSDNNTTTTPLSSSPTTDVYHSYDTTVPHPYDCQWPKDYCPWDCCYDSSEEESYDDFVIGMELAESEVGL
jgi:hypothetical protein